MDGYSALRQLGLSKQAIACYESLFNEGGTTGLDLARRLGLSRTYVYRLLRELEKIGFTDSFKDAGGIAYFHAVPLNLVLMRLAEYQRRLVRPVLEEQWQILERRNPPLPTQQPKP